MGISVEIHNSPHSYMKRVVVKSGDQSRFGSYFLTTTEVSDGMSVAIPFGVLIDNIVRDHCRQKAENEYRQWKECE